MRTKFQSLKTKNLL